MFSAEGPSCLAPGGPPFANLLPLEGKRDQAI